MESSQRKIGVILSYIAILVNTLVGFFYVPILLKYMGQNEYGLYQLMGSLIAYFSIMDFGLSSTVIRYYSKYQETTDTKSAENVLGISRRIYNVLTLLVLIFGGIFYLNIENIFQGSLNTYEMNESKKIFIVLIFNIVITLITNIYTSVITANEKFIFIKLLSILQTSVQPFVVIALLSISPKAFTMTLILTSFNFLVGIIKVIYTKYILKTRIIYHYPDKLLLRSMLGFSLSVFTVSMVDQIFWRSNQIILGIVSGTSVVAIYSIAAQIYMNFMPLSTVIQGVFLPRITKLVSKKISDKELSDLFIRIGRIQFILLSCVLTGFVLYGEEFIVIWVGEKFTEAYWITLIILFPFMIDLIQNIGLTIMQAKDQYSFRAKIYLLMAILNIFLSVILSNLYGTIGAAFSLGTTMLIGNGIIMNIYYYFKVGIDIPLFWKNIIKMIPVLLIPMLLGFTLKYFIGIKGFISLFLTLFLYVVIYFFFMWILGMNRYEKNMLLEPMKKIYKKLKLLKTY